MILFHTLTDRNRGVLRGTSVARRAANYILNTGIHGTNTPFFKELWTTYSSHSGRICCKQWAKGLCVRSYWPLYGVNVFVPSQAVCSNDRALGWRPRLRLQAGRVGAGLDLPAPRLSHRPKAGGGVWLRTSHWTQGEETARDWVLLADVLPLHMYFLSLTISTFILYHIIKNSLVIFFSTG